jgi:peptidylprolyl isomerase
MKKIFLLLSLILLTTLNAYDNKYVKDPIYIIKTTEGPIEVRILKNEAPYAGRNFEQHVKNKYYNGNKFHRIVKKYFIQTGDPTGTGKGGKSIWNKPFKKENSGLKFDKPGILAMSGKNKNKSQFFITTNPIPSFEGKYTSFGYVVSGMDTVYKIANTKITKKYKPLKTIKIISIELKKNNKSKYANSKNRLQRAGRGKLIEDYKKQIEEEPTEDNIETYFQKRDQSKIITIDNPTEEKLVEFGIK